MKSFIIFCLLITTSCTIDSSYVDDDNQDKILQPSNDSPQSQFDYGYYYGPKRDLVKCQPINVDVKTGNYSEVVCIHPQFLFRKDYIPDPPPYRILEKIKNEETTKTH